MKILFISNIIGKKVGSFSMASIMAARELDIEYHMAANFNNSTEEQMQTDQRDYGITLHHIDFVRSPFDIRNRKAFHQVVELIYKEKIDAIHCNTPIGGLIGRLAGKKCRVNKVIYQAHGFHFYKGAPLKNWIFFYPIERLLAHWTDSIITINKEDYALAKRFHLRKHGKVYYVPGVGIDLNRYQINFGKRESIRQDLCIPENGYAIISVGELNENKNHSIVIKALKLIKKENVHYFLCGKGPLEKDLTELAISEGVSDKIHFLGYRADVDRILNGMDIYVMPSFREGLSRSLMEAMACGLPCVVSKIRGNEDLIVNEKGGFLCDATRPEQFAEAINLLISRPELIKKYGSLNREKIKEYSMEAVTERIKDIYKISFDM